MRTEHKKLAKRSIAIAAQFLRACKIIVEMKIKAKRKVQVASRKWKGGEQRNINQEGSLKIVPRKIVCNLEAEF